jgi:uroporphyrin-III C-methyltransferase/precorrin-2 dehydrogenase/sirohydrochlorin ferrochelatase
MFYPIYLDLRSRNVLVVGGGHIATGKVGGLLEAGARVSVVAPEVNEAIARWHAAQKIVWHAREFVEGDIDNQFIVISATDDKVLNARVYQLANAQQRVANAVDDLDNCNFIAPAIARQGELQVAISTAGKSPALAKQIRDRIQDEILTEEISNLADFLGSWRPEVKRWLHTYQRRQAFWEGVLESCVPGLLVDGDNARAADVMREFLRRAQAPSKPNAMCAVNPSELARCKTCRGV